MRSKFTFLMRSKFAFFMRSKFYLFKRLKLTLIFDSFDQEVNTSIMRSKLKKHY